MSDDFSANSEERSEAEQRRLANLKPFVKGQSGNPSGRPKKKPITEAYERLLTEVVPGDPKQRTYAEIIALSMMRSAMKGKIQAAIEVTDRTEGRPSQAVDMNHSGNVGVNVDDVRRKLAAKLDAIATPHVDAERTEDLPRES